MKARIQPHPDWTMAGHRKNVKPAGLIDQINQAWCFPLDELGFLRVKSRPDGKMDFLVFKRMPQSPSQRLATIDDLLLYRLSQLSAAAGAMVVRLCEGSHGVTRREWGVVAQLYGHQGLLPSELADRMRRDRARTSRALTALVNKGLIERVTLPHDRRSAWVSLTPSGRQLYEVLMPQVQAINAQLVSVLSAEEAAVFDDVLERLRQQASTMQGQWDLVLPKANRHLGRTPSTPE